MRFLGLGAVLALFLGLGIAVQGSPAQAQDVTEDWPSHAGAAIERGDCATGLSYVNAAREAGDTRALSLSDLAAGKYLRRWDFAAYV